MEPVSSIVPRTVAKIANGDGALVAPTPKTLPELVDRLRAAEDREFPDVVVDTKSIRMTSDGMIEVPTLKGQFGLTDWSRSSLASMLGIRWQRYAEDATESDLADEVNRRLSRKAGEVRVRTTRAGADVMSEGVVRAFVSPGYTSVPDSRVAWMLSELLKDEEPVKVERFHATDMTTSYMLSFGKSLTPRPGSAVGDVNGGVVIRNSGVGYASLLISLSLLRLICLNGMTVEDGVATRRTHRGLDDARLRSLLGNTLGNIGGRVRAAAENLAYATERALSASVTATIERLLVGARLPRKLVPEIETAYTQEPHASPFGIAQAFTLAAQSMAPELRIELEALAGRYLSTFRSN